MNAVFVVLTTYQLMVADAYANYIYNVYHKKSLVVIVGLDVRIQQLDSYSFVHVPNLEHGKIKRVWKRLFYGGNLFGFSPLKRQVEKVKDSFIFVFNDTEPVTNKLIRFFKKKYNKIVLVEEGIGTYVESCVRKKTFSEKIRVLFTNILGSKMQYRAIGDNKLIDYVIVWNEKKYKTLGKATDKVIIHQSKQKIFLDSKDFLKHCYINELDNLECEVLFLGQPVVENAGMLAAEHDFFQTVLRLIKDKKVLIKPHPRDIIDKYNKLADEFENVSILDKDYSSVPMECLVASCKPKIVIAHSSSAVINIANMLPTVKAIMLYKLDICREINKRIFGNLSKYKDDIFVSTNDNLYKPNSLVELSEIVEKNIPNEEISFDEDSTRYPEIDFLWTL